MAIKHSTTKAPGQQLFAVTDWNPDHVIDGDVGFGVFNATAAAFIATLRVRTPVLDASAWYTQDGVNPLMSWDGANSEIDIVQDINLGTQNIKSVGDLVFENGEYITNSTDDELRFYGGGGANNVYLKMNLDNAYFVALSAHKAIDDSLLSVAFAGINTYLDGIDCCWGNSSDARVRWNTAGNDHLNIYMPVGTATEAGFITITHRYGDNYAHGIENHPKLYMHSATAAATATTQWISFQHDASDGQIATGLGNIELHPAAYVVLDSSKADTGDPAGEEGMIYINTFDNVIKMYAEGAWRTLASW